MVFVLGIDIGSYSSKGVCLEDQNPLGSFDCLSGGDYEQTAERIREELLHQSRKSERDISWIVATGFGSKLVSYANETKTEIVCLAKGISSFSSTVRTVIDIGDLYTKIVRMDGGGGIYNFLLSGKCAGGSGRILQIIAKVLQIKLEEIGELSLKSQKKVDFHTGCAVFSESEAISRIAEGEKKEDLLAGLHRALAAQIYSLAMRIGVEEEVALVGGGARDRGLVQAFQEVSGYEVVVPPNPHMITAFGAALLAKDSVK
ncbi:MAG: acyl-CoA dehydratase activase [Thermodesulfobacteriota bacterium]